ncbi:uncharacterized protein PV07_10915 [Cladophialophora immunda]|uniref:Potassium channel domain-containing protein n=1 Tax=Cladophialophora immunda TaxID=569365 RepID=A0A0D1Z4V4_9EURO|nr:uncharacterized protein PV07_10915 [Cladophialophora immunda]KIW22636.1 hypothetical protein PV07_10915 [Cladophialophora immunda]
MDESRAASGRADHNARHSHMPLPNGVINIPRPEQPKQYIHEDEEDTVIDFNAPISWWIISTLFPLIAGTFGPLASTFNICALAIDWRTTVSSSSTESEGSHISDPGWLLAVDAISLAIAILANLALLVQMTGRISHQRASPVTIAGWYTSSLLLLGLLAATPEQLPLPTNTLATYSQAFYYAIFACIIYFLLASMLLITHVNLRYRAPPFSRSFKLTMSQRSLMLQTILFLSYLLAAGAVYSRIENWDFLDAVYFVNVTLFTIGLGDYHPVTHLGRSLLFPMAIGGILFVGLIIASIRTLVLESGSRKISTRTVEKARRKVLNSGIEKIRELAPRDSESPKLNADPATSELDRRKLEFKTMRDVQRRAGRANRLIALSISGSSFFGLWFIGAVVFWQAESATGGENWSYFEALYFTYVALLTIGYAEFYPQSNSGKLAFVFWSLIALPTLTVLIGAIGDTISDLVASTTLWLSKHAPESLSILRDAKAAMEKKRNREGAFQEAKPAGFMDDESAVEEDFEDQNIPKAIQALGGREQNNAPGTNARPKDEKETQALLSAYRLHILLSEMQNVVQHLDAQPPRKYTYEEWTWFLKLISEDESAAPGHRHPWEHDVNAAAPMRETDDQKWSWLGQESPLMSMEDEPKWVQARLLEVAQRKSKGKGDFWLEVWRKQREKGSTVSSR